MKRKTEDTDRAVFGDVLKATTVDQRAWIGAVVLIYNQAEAALHKLTGSCLGYIGLGISYTVTSRVNGTDGLIAIVLAAAESIQVTDEQLALFKSALKEHGFSHLKPLRDAVVHSVLADTNTQTAMAPGGRGERQDVLLSIEALEGLYKRLVFLEREIRQLEIIVSCTKAIRFIKLFGTVDDERRLLNEQDIQEATVRCQYHQQQRLSLPPFPKFPEAPKQEELLQKFLDSDDPNKSISITVDRP